jgi:cellulose synthase/poly-beta-1,6-N-acetylglucosamine synthase-like glycosyltransferase
MLAVFAVSALVLIFSALDNAIRSRETLAEAFDVLGHSRFTPPVSVVVPAHNEEGMVMVAVGSTLAFDYPEFEVIVVDDGSTDATFDVLERELDLEPFGYYERRVVESGPVTGVYRSRSHDNVKVIRKENRGTKADACNCGLNFVRYRYVLFVDGDTLYEPDALLNCMRLAASDPQRVVGITGHISVASQPETTIGARAEDRELIDATLLSNFQHLEYLRSFLNTRLGWSRLGFMMCVSGAFGLWRRDIVEEVGGFSTSFSCEDLELTFRVHEHMRRTGRPYRILSIPEMVARTEAPGRVRALISQRARWQRVILESFWAYRHMLFNRRYGFVGLVGMPLMLLSEGMGLVFELVALATIAAGIAIGVFSWEIYLGFLGSMTFGLAVLTSAAVLMEDISTRAYRLRHIVRLIALGPLELLVYRPILMWARLRGTIGFLRNQKGWDKFERNARTDEPPVLDAETGQRVTHAA